MVETVQLSFLQNVGAFLLPYLPVSIFMFKSHRSCVYLPAKCFESPSLRQSSSPLGFAALRL